LFNQKQKKAKEKVARLKRRLYISPSQFVLKYLFSALIDIDQAFSLFRVYHHVYHKLLLSC